MFKVNNKNIRKRGEICSKLAIKTPELRPWHRSGVFIVNFEQISHLFLVLLLLNLNKYVLLGFIQNTHWFSAHKISPINVSRKWSISPSFKKFQSHDQVIKLKGRNYEWSKFMVNNDKHLLLFLIPSFWIVCFAFAQLYFVVNIEHISNFFLSFLLLTLDISNSFFDFSQKAQSLL